jgi:hypothetical protein
MEVVKHPRNAAVWEHIGVRDNILVEQYFLAACLEGASQGAEPDWSDGVGKSVRADFLFPSSAHAFTAQEAERAGYTHLIGDAKADPEIAGRLEARVRAFHPEFYARCLDAVGWPMPAGASSENRDG